MVFMATRTYYQVNPESIIFLDGDRITGYTTIAYDWTSDDVFLIRPIEYRVLKYIFDNGPVERESFADLLVDQSEGQTGVMLDAFTKKKILFSYEQ